MTEALRWLFLAVVIIIWLYVAARAVARAITRTLDERKQDGQEGKEANRKNRW